jgi:intracellular sulfur oxidation DsrE/DsrF family protein
VLRDNPPIREMLADLAARGAQVLVCPHCMEVMGVHETDLIEGAQVASRQRLFAHLGPDAVVFSY